MDDVTKTVKAILYDRVVDPFFRTYFFSWIFVNFRIFLVLLGDKTTDEKLDWFNSYLGDSVLIHIPISFFDHNFSAPFIAQEPIHNFLYPVFLTIFYIYILPFLTKDFNRKYLSNLGTRISQKQKQDTKDWIDPKTHMDIVEAYTQREIILHERISTFKNESAEFSKKNNELAIENAKLFNVKRELEGSVSLLADLKSELETSKINSDQLTKTIHQYDQEISSLKKELEDSVFKISTFDSAIEQQKNNVAHLIQQHNEAIKKANLFESENKTLKNQISKLTQKPDQSDKKLQILKSLITEHGSKTSLRREDLESTLKMNTIKFSKLIDELISSGLIKQTINVAPTSGKRTINIVITDLGISFLLENGYFVDPES